MTIFLTILGFIGFYLFLGGISSSLILGPGPSSWHGSNSGEILGLFVLMAIFWPLVFPVWLATRVVRIFLKGRER